MEEQARHALADRQATLKRLDEVRRQIGRLEDQSVLEDIRRDRHRDTR